MEFRRTHILYWFFLTTAMLVAAPAASQDLRAGTAAEILKHIAASESEVVLVNIWATWCSPCVQEFPDIASLRQTYDASKLDIVFVSLDFPEDLAETRSFLVNNDWNTTSYVRKGSDNDFVNEFIEEWTGAVPATFVYRSSGIPAWYKESITSNEELSTVIDGLLQ